jgi:tRNA U38,U39,U40 pseudouridine synthase TruA
MEEILKFIRQNWDFMTNDKCVPIEVALKLMDSSSLGLANDYNRFQRTHQELQQALKAIVNGELAFYRDRLYVEADSVLQNTIRALIALSVLSTRSKRVSNNLNTVSGFSKKISRKLKRTSLRRSPS